MLWQEEVEDQAPPPLPADVVDMLFRIECRTLPVDHAYALSRAVLAVLPWLAEEQRAGIHSVLPAESGNGWFRPEDPAQGLLHLSRRTPLMLRVPRARVADARALCGHTLDLDGYAMRVGEARERPLVAQSTLFARAVRHAPGESEAAWVMQVAEQLRARGITPRKILCGRPHAVRTPEGELPVRSVLVADLAPLEAIELQREGLGEGRCLGCGLFIGHKGVAPVARRED